MNKQSPSGPFVSALLQDMHVPVHAFSQQTPSTQKLLKHSVSLAQVAPS
jgi:hypothetical protein